MFVSDFERLFMCKCNYLIISIAILIPFEDILLA